MFKGVDGPLVVVVLDGVGEIDRVVGNAVKLAHMPYWSWLHGSQRHRTLRAHGPAVGLPSEGDMGNSEVGHNALGSGQVVDQGAKLVNEALASGRLFAGPVWQAALDQVKKHSSSLHFLGLLSDGNVHSHIRHLLAMIDRAAEEGVSRLRVHTLLDGRDVEKVSAERYLRQLEICLAGHRQSGKDYRIASGGGRMRLTMDRYEADWEMVAKGWQHHVLGEGKQFPDAMTALQQLRQRDPGIGDQDLPGFVVAQDGRPVGPVEDGDSVLFFNFRGDRAIEISRAFDEGDEFKGFERKRRPDVFYAGMMQYDGDLPCPDRYLVGPPNIQHTLSEFLIERGISQYAISETQKYGHVTYFWNGNRSGMQSPQLETFVEVPSDKIPFEQRPWMKAAQITDHLVAAILSGKHRFLRVNYANGDMVGHTGDLDASITAMSCLDLVLHRLMKAVAKTGGAAIITADHGNCDEMFQFRGDEIKRDDQGCPLVKTSHTLSPVPFVLYDPDNQIPGRLGDDPQAGIANLAATTAQCLGLEPLKRWETGLLVPQE